ncbi:hypothetical protein EV175_001781 [Coemansia sp. RSA 1933]|nr:hypothetical protein EV175_001781 [Coemansia sp. RSA 1933]
MATAFHDKDSRKHILWGTVGLAAIGGTIGLNIAILKNLQPVRHHARLMAANWALYGAVFLSSRELLLYDKRKRFESIDLPLWLSRDHGEMIVTVFCGSFTGGAMAFLKRRTKGGAASGALIFGLASAAGQLIYSALNRRRQSIILQRMQMQDSGSRYAEDTPHITDLIRGRLKDEEDYRSGSIISRFRRRFLVDPISLLPEWFPMRRIPPDEYHRMLVERKQLVFEELEQLRLAIADMRKREVYLIQRLRDKEGRSSTG